jgi:hypothetical protein
MNALRDLPAAGDATRKDGSAGAFPASSLPPLSDDRHPNGSGKRLKLLEYAAAHESRVEHVDEVSFLDSFRSQRLAHRDANRVAAEQE